MSLRSRILTALALVAGLVGSSLLGSPASAARADCYNYPGTICLTENSSWGGQVWRQYPSQIVGCRSLAPDGFNNEATLAANLTSSSIGLYLYDNSNCTGASRYLASGSSANLAAASVNFNDKASSLRVVYF
ncbi:hypothetical protein [Cryptosporangium aurantiacum]|uniref:Peptidase inhibitor family I36 n=1 Tax=Cryptosporangium aurantiacum TaxID=134849 RepID=A0A1M7R2P8_9ACTN|nr:hypothetical protein [Cryptosporangium aurantiacum]SHN39039.1 hypothetical protein SAMN05443668_106185 [Cryptosporangium aurantiacum]